MTRLTDALFTVMLRAAMVRRRYTTLWASRGLFRMPFPGRRTW